MKKPHVEIYSTESCPYCQQAKQLLNRKGISYEEIRVDLDPSKKDEMIERSKGRRTVPEIFINGELVGGFDDLWGLEKSGELDKKLGLQKP
jgi:GrxC family glutaredoxin